MTLTLHLNTAISESEINKGTLHSNDEESEYGLHMSIRKAKQINGQNAKQAIEKELKQMIDRQVWEYVREKDITRIKQKTNIIRSSMFFKEKYLANGEFEKLKARLAGGNMQDKTQLDSVASLTVSMTSVLIMLAIVAVENRKFVTIDVGGSYLEVDLSNSHEDEVLMYLETAKAEILSAMDKAVKPYVDEKGRIVVRLK